ncbi:MBL fold metallo-hydrolase [Streptomyces sp. H10-C2]|uniref:MBL fold metallo-hydrolase n=1 Tax=unclassified Streptomyces TaxID=2593676 RepID=UPI0024BBBB64|nr:MULTISPECIES: MBL fold metallo-hydrolase [unclassified Streptomyces]MDJ0345806.1 MBL fold metallo-hydrolase [Streptomyces sp. PH10-H1]MDJ0374696.1 MBL fold metallo-hydrolase [Streptomyces sp. H10-C2]
MDTAQFNADGWEQLAPGVARRRLPFLDVTIGLVVGDDGVLLIDTGSTIAEGAQLRLQVLELTGRPVTHIALTHGHFDHVFGTAAFAGVRVYGERSLDGYLEREQHALGEDAVKQGVDPGPASEAADVLVRPDQLVDDACELDLGGGRTALLFHPGAGHTTHDLAVFVPGTPGVLFCGDLVEESGEPLAGTDAAPAAWPATLDRLLALGGETALYVPGHGAVVDARFVRAQRDALTARFAPS